MINEDRLSDEDYKNKYLTNEFFLNQDSLKTKQIENFLIDEELDIFENATNRDQIFHVEDTAMNASIERHYGEHIAKDKITANYYIYSNFYTDPTWKDLVDILQPKIEFEFGNGIYASHIHVLESHTPYGIHSDATTPNMKFAPVPAYTLIIPLETVDSRTYQFDQRSNHKVPYDWIREENIKPMKHESIGQELYERDFAPFTHYDMFKYLTIESVFQWKRGSLNAADRYRFHCSDNYFNRGLERKKAIVAWTSTEK